MHVNIRGPPSAAGGVLHYKIYSNGTKFLTNLIDVNHFIFQVAGAAPMNDSLELLQHRFDQKYKEDDQKRREVRKKFDEYLGQLEEYFEDCREEADYPTDFRLELESVNEEYGGDNQMEGTAICSFELRTSDGGTEKTIEVPFELWFQYRPVRGNRFHAKFDGESYRADYDFRRSRSQNSLIPDLLDALAKSAREQI